MHSFHGSDLIHHQNNGATSEDLAAGVCLSIVHNYLEKVANNKPIGKKALFLGGVAATPAVRAAFEQQTDRPFQMPPFFKVSGALGLHSRLWTLSRPVSFSLVTTGVPALILHR